MLAPTLASRSLRVLIVLFCMLQFGARATAQSPGWHRLPTGVGSASQGLAFDEHRGRMVRVEASAWHGMFHTWEWIDGAWSLRRTANTPPLRDDFAFAYDPVRKRSLLFGGRRLWNFGAPGAMLNDTWEYDGVDWQQVNTQTSPPPQLGGWMGFDHATNRMMLIGGASTPSFGGMWFFDGATWISGGFSPLFYSSTGFASDPVRQRIVAVTWGVGPDIETHEWNGVSWAQVPAAFAPPRRIAPRMAFVEQRQSVVMIGGGVMFGTVNDMWEWDGSTWSLVSSNPTPTRQQHLVAHDPDRNRLIVLGGMNAHNTIEWDGSDWTSTEAAVGWDEMQNAYFDHNRQAVVSFGYAPDNQMEWDGKRWHREASPLAMVRPKHCFDTARSRAVVLGTIGFGLVTIEWDGSNWGAWSLAALPCEASLTFHQTRGRVMACCGSGGLWEWDGVVWTMVAPGPGGIWLSIADANAVYDAARDEIVLLGWQGAQTQTATWNGATWSITTGANGPQPRTLHDIAFDPSRQRVALFGGSDATTSPPTYFDHLWEWDGSVWQQRVLPNAPRPRIKHGLVFDPIRQQLLVIGGRSHLSNIAEVPFAETWAVDAQPVANVAVVGPGCSGTSGPAHLITGAPYPGAAVVPFEVHSQLQNVPCMFGFGFAAGAVPVGAGCTQYLASQDQLWLGFTSSAGIATNTANMPLSLFGFSFVVQAAVFDPSNPRGVTLTEGVQVTVGH